MTAATRAKLTRLMQRSQAAAAAHALAGRPDQALQAQELANHLRALLRAGGRKPKRGRK